MKLLVLGGTVFVSRAIAATAVRRGHEVTCAHRGRSGLGPSGVTDVFLDRDVDGPDGVAALTGHRYDAVVDVATQDPRWVADAIDVLGAAAGHWTFVSSISAYADAATPGQDASAARVPPLDAATPPGEHYARAKRSSEDVVLQALGEKAFVVRPGLVVGPGDPTDRYGYWPARFARGGPVLVPDVLDSPAQLVDVDDLAAWVVTAAEHRLVAQLDAVTPPRPLREVLADSGGADHELVPVAQQRLVELGVRPWSGPRSLPLWVPQPEMAGFGARDVAASTAAGLVLRPIAETAERALAHERALGPDRERRSGLTPAEEQDVLRALG